MDKQLKNLTVSRYKSTMHLSLKVGALYQVSGDMPKIDKFRQKLVDFTFHSSLFTKQPCRFLEVIIVNSEEVLMLLFALAKSNLLLKFKASQQNGKNIFFITLSQKTASFDRNLSIFYPSLQILYIIEP